MKLLLLLVCVAMAMTEEEEEVRLTSPSFTRYMEKYNKQYETADEHNLRFWTYYKNSKLWNKENRRHKEAGESAVYGATKFADLSKEEFAKFYLNKVMAETDVEEARTNLPAAGYMDTAGVPDSVDWRDMNAVTPVKNQGRCGSCWAFSTTGNVEGQYAIKTGNLTSLSEQELVDCDKVDEGCNGGLPSQAYLEIKRIGGLELETDYPYTGHGDKCSFDKSMAKVQVSGGTQLPKDEAQIAAWIAANGPVSIGINAFMMQFYMGGIAHPWWFLCRPARLDHGVLITGFGEEGGVPYWNIKNSWGTGWGEQGYYRIFRGGNSCGVSEMVTSATL